MEKKRFSYGVRIYLILGLVISLISFSLFNCKTSSLNNDDEEVCEYPLRPATGNVGDTIRSCHFEITLHKAEYNPREYCGPSVIVHATIKLIKSNGTGANICIDSFTIQDSVYGNIYREGGCYDDNELPQITLSEGEEISGTSSIRVSKDVSGFTAIFNESRLLYKDYKDIYKDTIKWKLNF